MSNTWPGGKKHAMHQNEHEAWNDASYPGTRQLCWGCEEPTGRCEDDEMIDVEGSPYCEECYKDLPMEYRDE